MKYCDPNPKTKEYYCNVSNLPLLQQELSHLNLFCGPGNRDDTIC